jgi:uncharacterized protein with PQ loop repeat
LEEFFASFLYPSFESKKKGIDMNIYQRIVLILGGLLLFIVLASGSYIRTPTLIQNIVMIVGPTLLIFWALKGIGKKK